MGVKAPNIYKTKFGKGLSALGHQYQQGINNTPGDYMSSEFLTPLYQQVGAAQQQGAQQLRGNAAAQLGSNSSGMLPQQLSQLAASSPYGAANTAARQQGFQRFQQLGEGLKGVKGLESTWRSSRIGENQAWEALDLQKEALENQMYMAGAQGGSGGGGGDALGSVLGVVGQVLPLLLGTGL